MIYYFFLLDCIHISICLHAISDSMDMSANITAVAAVLGMSMSAIDFHIEALSDTGRGKVTGGLRTYGVFL